MAFSIIIPNDSYYLQAAVNVDPYFHYTVVNSDNLTTDSAAAALKVNYFISMMLECRSLLTRSSGCT